MQIDWILFQKKVSHVQDQVLNKIFNFFMMNYFKFTFLPMSSLFYSYSTTSKINRSDAIRNRFEGVDNIKIGASGVKEIKETYGNQDIVKYCESWRGGSIFPFFFIGSYNK